VLLSLFCLRLILPRITNFQKKPVSNFLGALSPSIGCDKDGGPFSTPAMR
jgi:hypothetical protein